MKKCVLNAVLLLTSSAQLVCLAQDTTKAAGAKPADKPAAPAVRPAETKTTEKAAEKAAEKTEEKKTTNRLPSNYGKLGLTDA